MAYSIPDCFMAALICGFVFGLVYEAFRIVRLVLRVKPAVFLCDVLFFALAAEVVFRLSMAMGNYVRIYTLLGFGAGLFAYIETVGRFLNMIESAAAVVWRKTIGRAARFIWGKVKAAFGKIAQKSSEEFVKAAKILKSTRKKHVRHLKSDAQKEYNKNTHQNTGGSETGHVIKAKVTRGL